VYKQDVKAVPNIYFILYGSIKFTLDNYGDFGEILGVGYTVGEEILFENDESVYRSESAISIGDSCLL
jgi:hypothetical protein